MLFVFLIKLEIKFIFVETFEPPIIQVTGSFLFSIIELIAVTSFFKRGPAYASFIYFVILWIEACFLWEQEKASFINISPSEAILLAKLSSFSISSLKNLIFSIRIISPSFKYENLLSVSSFISPIKKIY